MVDKKYAYAGNRGIGLNCLLALNEQGWLPSAILLPRKKKSSCDLEMIEFANETDIPVFRGGEIYDRESLEVLRNCCLDYIISVHFPEIFKAQLLDIPKIGIMNLHPAFLPFNRGWHTPSWSIWDGTKYGATLHWVDEGVDTGDIIEQSELCPSPADTANTLYQRVLSLEQDLFKKAIPGLRQGVFNRTAQKGDGSFKKKSDLEKIREIDLNSVEKGIDFLRKLRALTTNDLKEAAFFIEGEKKYLVQVNIIEEERN